jgi:hypothetical protein
MNFIDAIVRLNEMTGHDAEAWQVVKGGLSPHSVAEMGGKLDLFANLLTETDFSESALRGNELGALLHRYVVATERTAAALEWLTTLATGDGAGKVRFDYAERLTAAQGGPLDELDQREYCQGCGTLLDDDGECAVCYALDVVDGVPF